MSAQCTSRVSTLLSHHLFPSTNHGGCFIVKCLSNLVHALWWWLCLQPVITEIDDVACCCEKRLMLFELLRDGIIRICPSELFESTNDLVSMVLCLKCICGKKAMALAPVSSNTRFLSAQAQSSVSHSAHAHKATLLESAMSLTNGQLTPPFKCGHVNVAPSTMGHRLLPSPPFHMKPVTLLPNTHSACVGVGSVDWRIVHYENKKSKRKKNGFTETRTQDPVCVRHM